VCNCVLRDSQSYLDHVNGKYHQRALGMNMNVEKSSLEQVGGWGGVAGSCWWQGGAGEGDWESGGGPAWSRWGGGRGVCLAAAGGREGTGREGALQAAACLVGHPGGGGGAHQG
jgi:hypothetical protein